MKIEHNKNWANLNKLFRVLETPTNMATLLATMSEYNYATKISKLFGVKQPIVTRRLTDLMHIKLIYSVREGKKVIYFVNWDIFYKIFYSKVNLKLNEQVKQIRIIIEEKVLKGLKAEILNKKFIKDYFSSYLSNVTTTSDQEIMIRGLEPTIDLLFTSLEWLSNHDKKQFEIIINKYKLNEKKLKELVYQFTLIIAGAGIESLQLLSLYKLYKKHI